MTPPRNIPAEHFQLLLESAPGSFLILLPDAHFTIAAATNDYLQDTLTSRENILGKPLFEVFPDNPYTPEANSTRNLQASLQRVVATKATDAMGIQRYDVPKQDGTGFEVRYWSPVNTPALSANGDLLYIIHRVQNVTDYMRLAEENAARRRESVEMSAQNRKMEAEILQHSLALDAKNTELRRANEELMRYAYQARDEAENKDEFLAMLAHELRNPLAGISGALELLEIIGHDPAKAAQLRQVCHRQLGNLTRLVDDLLDVSRVSRGVVPLHREPLDLRDIVGNALHAVRGLLNDKDLALNTRIASGTYRMLGDATRLEQVLTNLLTNAAKYTDGGGCIDIALTTEDGAEAHWAVLQVKDTGRGIPPEKLSAIFNMFVQIDPSIDRTRGGLGIGLTLVKKLVERHGGTVSAESQGPQCGSTFTVRLPLDVNVSLPALQARSDSAPVAESGTARVLVIEDNADARETLKNVLEAYGYTVEVAATGEEGLQRLLTLCPDVAIVDIGLPGLDGFELARRARAAPEGKAVKLVALSGYSGPETEQKASRVGFDLHLIKPVNAADLRRIIRTRPSNQA